MPGRTFIAKETFATHVHGIPEMIYAEKTLVNENHELYKRFPSMFKLAESRFADPTVAQAAKVEAASAAPGEVRGEKVKG